MSARVNLQTESEPPSDDETDSARLQVEQAQVSLDQAKLSLASAEKGLAATQLAAPVAGTVTGMDLGLGQMVSNGQTGAVLADLTNLQVEIGLDESDIAQVSLGQPAQVTLDAFDDVVLDGVISHVAPTAEIQSGVVLYNVMVSLDATQIPARVGMTADVEVITRSAANTLIIPLKAVRSLNGGSFVLRRLRDGEEAPSFGARPSTGAQPIRPPAGVNLEDIQAMRAQMQNFQAVEGFVMARVELGVMTDAYAEVYSGLDEGDEVLVSSSAVTASAPSGPGGMFGVMRGRP